MPIDAQAAVENLKSEGVTFKEEFFKLFGSKVQAIYDEGKRQGYRKPTNANGSYARYFFEAVKRRLK